MARRDGFVVVVTFKVVSEFRTAFHDAVLENAHTSRTTEPGCSIFDVCESPDTSEIFLYEVYDSEAAFKEHLATEHFRRFDALVAPWTAGKRATTYHRLVQD